MTAMRSLRGCDAEKLGVFFAVAPQPYICNADVAFYFIKTLGEEKYWNAVARRRASGEFGVLWLTPNLSHKKRRQGRLNQLVMVV